MENVISSLTLLTAVVILVYNVVSSYAIRGNDLKHLSNKIDDVMRRIERLENRIFEKKE